MQLFEFVIALRGDRGNTAKVRIQADNAFSAKCLAEAQYGAANIIGYYSV